MLHAIKVPHDDAGRALGATRFADMHAAYDNLPAPLKPSMTFKCYVGGHMMYRDTDTRTAFSRDVRALVSGQ